LCLRNDPKIEWKWQKKVDVDDRIQGPKVLKYKYLLGKASYKEVDEPNSQVVLSWQFRQLTFVELCRQQLVELSDRLTSHQYQ